jgi:hypothetical protein
MGGAQPSKRGAAAMNLTGGEVIARSLKEYGVFSPSRRSP